MHFLRNKTPFDAFPSHRLDSPPNLHPMGNVREDKTMPERTRRAEHPRGNNHRQWRNARDRGEMGRSQRSDGEGECRHTEGQPKYLHSQLVCLFTFTVQHTVPSSHHCTLLTCLRYGIVLAVFFASVPEQPAQQPSLVEACDNITRA